MTNHEFIVQPLIKPSDSYKIISEEFKDIYEAREGIIGFLEGSEFNEGGVFYGRNISLETNGLNDEGVVVGIYKRSVNFYEDSEGFLFNSAKRFSEVYLNSKNYMDLYVGLILASFESGLELAGDFNKNLYAILYQINREGDKNIFCLASSNPHTHKDMEKRFNLENVLI